MLLALFFILTAMAAPWLAPLDDPENFTPFRKIPTQKSFNPLPPGQGLIMGSLPFGQVGAQMDVFFTLVWGTRQALGFGLKVALFTAFLGVLIGAVSAQVGGLLNWLSLRVTDAFLAFPVVAAVVFFEQLIRASNPYPWIERMAESPLTHLFDAVDSLTLALIMFSWMPYARLTNSMVLHIKGFEYIQAARALGASPWRTIFRHILPNAISPAVVLAARDIGGMVLLQATLTFIGVGRGSYWGDLLVQGRNWIMGMRGNPFVYWWVFVPPTLTLVMFGVSWNLIGDGINEALNPHESRKISGKT